jgi:hypothetical protein
MVSGNYGREDGGGGGGDDLHKYVGRVALDEKLATRLTHLLRQKEIGKGEGEGE